MNINSLRTGAALSYMNCNGVNSSNMEFREIKQAYNNNTIRFLDVEMDDSNAEAIEASFNFLCHPVLVTNLDYGSRSNNVESSGAVTFL